MLPTFGRVEWMLLYQGMIVLAGNQVWWTWEVEDVFQKAKKGGKTAMKVRNTIQQLSLSYNNMNIWISTQSTIQG